MPKRNVIIDHKNVTEEILEAMLFAYPYGYDEDDLMHYTNARGEKIEALEVKTEEVNYLIKVGIEMDKKMEIFVSDDDEDDDLESDGDDLEIPDGDID